MPQAARTAHSHPSLGHAGRVCLFAPPGAAPLAHLLRDQAQARGLAFEHHDANTPDPDALLAPSRPNATPIHLVIFAGESAPSGSALNTPASAWQAAWASQCLGGLRVGQAAIRAMRPQQRGTLIYLGHQAGLTDAQAVRRIAPGAFSASQAVASAGMRALSQSMARAFGPQRVHVAHVVLDNAPTLVAHPDAIAQACWLLHDQDPTAWTHELDLRTPQASPWTGGKFVQ
jgi:NAD(P)-dependent dehydrogenase (short-subunit alcohol dehydrogenase family)